MRHAQRGPSVDIPGILNPPDEVPERLPTRSRNQRLPFEDLTWENFERLCLRIVATDADVEYCARFGLAGEAQAGIDVFARRTDGTYRCLQAKRQRVFGATKVKDAVNLFLEGEWAGRSNEFTIAVQAGMGSVAVQREIEKQAQRLRDRGIRFQVFDGDKLTEVLRGHPAIIDDFFGRAWVKAVVSAEAGYALGARLDGGELARVRQQLARYYEAHFQTIDPGSFGSAADNGTRPALTLLERFVKPDVVVREAAPVSDQADYAPSAAAGASAQGEGSGQSVMPDSTRSPGGLERSRSRRLPISELLSGEQRLVVLGDAGSGKSTVLRAIALDLLGEQTRFPELGERFGRHLPIHVSFARWASETARDGARVGLKEIVRRSLQPMLTSPIVELLDRAIDERRVLLLVDGLDEWNAEQAARTTLSHLITMVAANDMPAIVSGRPRGLETIGQLPAEWRRGTIAPLSESQQRVIAGTWFDRHAPAGPEADGSLRTQRFMAELARDPGLSALAGTPLLLVGLVTLSLRGQTLPRTKIEVYDQLVRILLEVHPVNRATASGDTVDRFRHARNADQRRAAIARLAFEARLGAGDASLPDAQARAIIREYFEAPSGCGFPPPEAAAAAAEILSVNAETQGLIVEKGPGEVGFVHASFEEFLAAEHVAGWPLADTVEFVRARSGEPRWRNVLTDLMAGLPRRDEFDRLVGVIEEPADDELSELGRLGLLGEIAFTSARRSPATTRRLALDTMRRVDDSDRLPARRDALFTVLRHVNEPAFEDDVRRRLNLWAPARASHRSSLMSQLGRWDATPALSETIWRGLHDEDQGVQRAAAAAYARAFRNCHSARERLVQGLADAWSVTASAAMLEALIHGWTDHEDTARLADEAARSVDPDLRLVGAFGRAEAGRKTDTDRDEALIAQQFWSGVSYPHRELAGAMIQKHWPDDDDLLPGALARANGDFDSPWEMELAFAYVLNASTERANVRAFILRQLGKRFPFNVLHWDNIWSRIGAFALADPEIRAAANSHWADPEHRLVSMHKLADYAEVVPDDEIAAILIEGVRGEKSMDRYWALSALLRGWSSDHAAMRPLLEEIAELPAEQLSDIVALLPRAIPDAAEARARVLAVAGQKGVRHDMVALALEELGCDAQDDEAVRTILGEKADGPKFYSPADVLFRTFAAHPDVRKLAMRLLEGPEPPLGSIAKGYGDDPEISDALLRIATPLPTELRSQIVEFAVAGSAGTALEGILAEGPREADPDLRVRMMTAHLRSLTDPAAIAEAKRELLSEVVAVGTDHDARRSAGLAGLIALRDVGDLVGMQGYNSPLTLQSGGMLEVVPSLERLICEEYGLLVDAFGPDLAQRFDRGDHGNRLAEILATYPSASPRARATFLRMAEDDTMPLTVAALRSLAVERPRSALLLKRCRQALALSTGGNDRPAACAEIALILAAEFPSDPAVRAQLEETFRNAPHSAAAVALAVFAPESEVIALPSRPEEMLQFGDLITAMYVLGARGETAAFIEFLDAMVTRSFHTQFDGQRVTNLAVTARIRRDEELRRLLADRLATRPHPSILGSNARQLAAAGMLGPEERDRVAETLARVGRDQRIPIAGYDAVGARWRALRATLLDALRSEVE